MIFSSLIFLYLFLPICLLCYAGMRNVGGVKGRNAVLIVFSLLFYAWGEPVRIVYLLLSAAVNYLCGLGVGKLKAEWLRKIILILSLIYNLGMIGYFKYSGFLMENVNALFGQHFPVPEIAQLVGISFYTFQVISYVVDCYWEKVEAQVNPLKFLLYVALFPQLIAGPIVRYSTIAAEIDDRRTTVADLSSGMTRFVVGLAKKVILANELYRIVKQFLGTSPETLTVCGTWYGVILYSLYIYYDFSGYSDMAIGLGRIFGFHFDENFDHPYLCKDITEFWQRWHISLGTFFRDYLLPIPVFGIRNKYLSLALVWLCTGIWHGASWNYILWGLYYGAFILLETKIGKKKMRKIPIVLRHIYNKIVIIIGFGIFYFEDSRQLLTFFRNLTFFNPNGFFGLFEQTSVSNNLILIIVSVVCTFPLLSLVRKLTEKWKWTAPVVSAAGTVLTVALLITSSILLVDATTNPFLYYRF
ncbi:MAG: MBOAT family protein [Oscillospiraceae bacterium]|nr:MBOAT family protein [Oscillospiraceae bacterium]